MQNEDKLLKFLAQAKSDPVFFAERVIGVSPTWQQKEILEAIKPYGSKVSVRSGHGVGKSAVLSWAILWFLLTQSQEGERIKIPCTAPSSHQLFDILWPELVTWSNKMNHFFSQHIDRASDKMWIKGQREEKYVVARTARKEKPEALQGFHAENLMFVIDEASGVDEAIFETAEGALSTPGARIIMCSNPTRTDGYFWRSQVKERQYWTTLKYSCLDSPLVDPLYVERMAKRYGEDSSVYRVRVLGEFPESSDNTVIPLNLLESAIGRDVRYEGAEPVAGIDIARGGGDANAIVCRKGGEIFFADRWFSNDLMVTTGRIMKHYNEGKFRTAYVDAIGLGAGVADRLKELNVPAIPVQVSELAAHGDLYHRLRDELWFMSRDYFSEKNCCFTDELDLDLREALISELATVTYKYTSTGKLLVESKEDLKARLGKDGMSPNLADAFNLSLCKLNRYRERKRAVPVQVASSKGWT